MLHYILQIVAFQAVFLLIYDVFLKRETFFNYNRLYLLATSVLSFVLPFIKLETIKAVAPNDFVIVLPEVIIGNINSPTELNQQVALQVGIEFSEPSLSLWQVILYIGIIMSTLIFLLKLVKLFRLKTKNPSRWKDNVIIVNLLNSSAAFSFFNTIFIGNNISSKEKPTILKHELVHVREYHSIDLLVFELMRILLWFNPLVYMYQNRIKALHEFIADEIAVKQDGKKAYYKELLNQIFETNNLSFTNTFFKKSLIKKRIAMLQKTKSKHVALVKYALLIPVVFGMLIYTSAEVKAQEPSKVHTTTEVVEIQEISDKELKQKYYNILSKMFEEKISISEITAFAFPKGNHQKYKMSKEEYYRMSAFIELMNTKHRELIDTKDEIVGDDKKVVNSIKEITDRSYDEYLEWLKTSEAKESWESAAKDGVLRLFVEDLKNITRQEEKRREEKLEIIEQDNYWNALLISDGVSSTKMIVHEIDGNKIQDYINKDAVSSKNVIESVEVPYAVIENVPTFEDCKSLATNTERKKCTSEYIAKFVNKNFNTDLAVKLGLTGRQRLSVGFKVSEEGFVKDIYVRAPHPELEKEAKRVISMLPKFTPGTQKGKPVTVPYTLPIIFQVQDKPAKEQSFSKVNKAPIHKDCITITLEEERKKCTSQNVSKFINKNFNMELASSLGLTGTQRIIASFKIGKDGRVFNSFAKAPHEKLKEETIRVINNLPQFVPGENENREKVDVSLSLPIVFYSAPNKETKD